MGERGLFTGPKWDQKARRPLLQTPFLCSEPSGPPPVRLPAEVKDSGILGSVVSSFCFSDSWVGPLHLLPVFLKGVCPEACGAGLWGWRSRILGPGTKLSSPGSHLLGRRSQYVPWVGRAVTSVFPRTPRAGVCPDTEGGKDETGRKCSVGGASLYLRTSSSPGRGRGSVPIVGSAQARRHPEAGVHSWARWSREQRRALGAAACLVSPQSGPSQGAGPRCCLQPARSAGLGLVPDRLAWGGH